MLGMIFYLFFLILFCFLNNFFMFVFSLFFFFFFFFFYYCNVDLEKFSHVSYFFGLDKVSFLFINLSVWVCILMIYSVVIYFNNCNNIFFLLCMNFLVLMLFIVFLVLDFFFFYFFFEGSLIPVFLIIFGWGYQPERLMAGFYLIFYTLFASFPFLLVILFIMNFYGGFFFFFDFKLIDNFLMFFILFSFMIKFPLFGFHLWLPSAHVEAPVMGSMVLAGVLLKLGGYGFIRSMSFIYYFIINYGYLFFSISIFGCLLISLFCLIQSDLKMLIAYSSVCHMGMVICGLFTLSSWGVLGSLVFMLGHGFVSSGLFFLVGVLYDRLGSRSFFLIKGMINFIPSMTLFWFIFCILNMSCPPSINLFSEISIMFGLISWSSFSFFFLLFIFFFSACYSITVFFLTQHGSWSSLLSFCSSCYVREYYILILHLYPVFFMMFDMYFFF
uniref:NADH dehydrogenase subunit 4 n=1 Tax=Paravarcia deceptrix TaxID=1200249 RepID=UPI002A801A4C|nr:NADH dehydrogenase subunit 4 [Paravarcia deceptrix]WOW99108.1 NADH dehydrogenase subunit 4 [Paravarcia deceptrix]